MRWPFVNKWQWLLWLFGGALLLIPICGWACPSGIGKTLPNTVDGTKTLVENLSSHLADCENNAAFLAWYGAALRQAERYPEAAVWLERALLLQPSLLGVQLDYADTLAALGEWPSARSLWSALSKTPQLPHQLQQLLEHRLSIVDSALLPVRRGHWALKIGRDDNLTSAPKQTNITITLPSGEINLPLSDNFRPNVGNLLLLEAGVDYTLPPDLSGQQWHWYGEIRLKHTPTTPSAQYQQVDLGVVSSHKKTMFGGAFTQHTANGKTLYQSLRVNHGWQWQKHTCPLSANLELDMRRYPSAEHLDNYFIGMGIGGVCATHEQPIKFALRLGQEFDYSKHRLGGDSWRFDSRIEKQWALPHGYVLTDIGYSFQRDSRPYSPLLAHGAVRYWHRTSVKIEYIYPITKFMAVTLSAERYDQHSNLSLFTATGHAWYAGWRYDWF